MDRPPSLVGRTVGGAFICEEWELRVTARCLADDLNAEETADFDAVAGLEIVKALVHERSTHPFSTRQVSPLTSGHEVWVLSRGDDHRGGTFYDQPAEVVWLLAYGRHRSGEQDDFFPYCKELDADGRLIPTEADIRRMYFERDKRFVEAVRVEAPLILRDAQRAEGEHTRTVGGELGVSVSIEIVDELDMTAITVAFMADAVETYEQGIVLLASLSPGEWEMIDKMPSRELRPAEVAFTITIVSGEPT